MKFSIDTFYGLHEICIHKGQTRPKSFDECFKRKSYNGVNHGIPSNYEIVSITSKMCDDGKLEGSYYLAIHAVSYTSLNVIMNFIETESAERQKAFQIKMFQ